MKKIIIALSLLVQSAFFAPLANATDNSATELVVEPFVSVEGNRAIAEKVGLLIHSKLSALDDITLLERESLTALVDERTLSGSTFDGPDQSTRGMGIKGARFILGGSILEHQGTVHLFGKLISVADGSMHAFTAKSQADSIAGLTVIAATQVQSLINNWIDTPRPENENNITRMATLAKQLNAYEKPTLSVSIEEQHNRRRVADRAVNRQNNQPIDPAAETEFLVFSVESGFGVVDKDPRFEEYVDVLILGEGFTEVSYRNGSALGVTARLEVKAVSRKTGRLLAIDRQTSVVVAGSELIGSKDALAKASAAIAERMLPKLVLASQ